MGKGDKRSKKGKIRLGSYGNSRRKRNPAKTKAKAAASAKKTAAKKPAKKAAKKGE